MRVVFKAYPSSFKIYKRLKLYSGAYRGHVPRGSEIPCKFYTYENEFTAGLLHIT